MNRISLSFRSINWQKVGWITASESALLMVVASFFLPGGDDLYRYYRPFAEGCLHCGFVPYFASWILWPLVILPKYPLSWPLWTFFSLALFLIVLRFTRVNPALVLLSFPLLGQVWLGQIDALIVAGLAIFWLAPSPYLRGLGMTLALVKPQLTGLAILLLLFQENRQVLWKVLLTPVLVLAASLLVFGLNWPVDWLRNSSQELPAHVWRLAAEDIWHYGIILLPLPFLIHERQKRLSAGLLVASLATPFFGVYSYAVFLVFYEVWWSLPLSYAWALAYPWLGADSMRLAWILPAALLMYMLYSDRENIMKAVSFGERS